MHDMTKGPILSKIIHFSIFIFIFKKAPSNEIITKHTKSKYTL